MSDINIDGFKASPIFSSIKTAVDGFTEDERKTQVKKIATIFELRINNAQQQQGVWTIDFKDKGSIYVGPVKAPSKASVTITMSDDTFVQLASGKLDPQKAFMTGKLKTKGNLMLATKLLPVLEVTKVKAKL